MCLLETPSPVDPGVNTTRSMRVVHPDSFIVRWGRADPDAMYNLYLISKIYYKRYALSTTATYHGVQLHLYTYKHMLQDSIA
jgi:hypothetical protein